MKKTPQEISSWIVKLSEIAAESSSEAYDFLLKGKEFATQAFKEGIRVYDLDPLIVRIYLETGRCQEALNYIDGQDEFKRKIERGVFFSILDDVFSNVYTDPSGREKAQNLINITKNDKHGSSMTLGLEIDLGLYGNSEEYDKALSQIDAIIAKPPVLSFDSRYDADIIAFKACIAAALRKDFETAGKYMQIMLKANPKSMVKLNYEIKNNEELVDFKKSTFFKQTQQIQPKEKFLLSAYEAAEDEPYKVFQSLEKKKKEAKDLADLISVQHYCIALICSDIEEHGDSNMEEYGKGKVSVKEFKQIKKDLETELKEQMKKSKIKQTIFWQYKNFKSFKEIPF